MALEQNNAKSGVICDRYAIGADNGVDNISTEPTQCRPCHEEIRCEFLSAGEENEESEDMGEASASDRQ